MDRLTFTDEFRKEHELGAISYLASDLLANWEAKLKAYEDTGFDPSEIDKAISIQHWEDACKEEFERNLAELTAYRTAEEQGLLVRLPCKVGDTIWRKEGMGANVSWEISQIVTLPEETIFIDDSDNEFRAEDIGKTVFLTREEAEEALKNG